ncbi:hypothetical protein R3Q06_13505 [Rhodococcus erythropolis]|nr:hypothetical protein [Rhodococcus erythropolis]MDV6274514.1 hypothetical protein [Rhodococcus erythropolis]
MNTTWRRSRTARWKKSTTSFGDPIRCQVGDEFVVVTARVQKFRCHAV